MPDFDPYLAWLGIPPTQRPPNYYQLLGVDPAITDPAVVKTLAIQRIAFVRNFQRGEHGEVCAKILEELAKAEMALTNPVSRAEYDRSLRPVAPPPQAKPIAAKAIAIPAARIPEPAPIKRPRRRKRKSDEIDVVKWSIIGVLGLGILVGLVSIGRMALGPSKGTLAIAFEQLWMDATMTVDGRRVEVAPFGGEIPLPVGEHTMEVSRGPLGSFHATFVIASNAVSDVRVPSSAFRMPTPSTANVPKPKPRSAKFQAIPNDATVAVTSGNATIKNESPFYTLDFDPSALGAGIDVKFSKKGFYPKTVRVQQSDVDSGAIVDVKLEQASLTTMPLTVVPASAMVSVENGEAKRGENGKWSIVVQGEAPTITVEAPGYVSQTFIAWVSAGPMTVTLKRDKNKK